MPSAQYVNTALDGLQPEPSSTKETMVLDSPGSTVHAMQVPDLQF